MTERPAETPPEPDLPGLLKEIVSDVETLVGQQVRLIRAEVTEEIGRASESALALGTGAGLVAAGGLFAALAAVHALHRGTRLPLWGCYGLVGGLLGASGAGLLASGRARAARVRLVPPESTEALKENLSWLKEQVNTLATE